MSKYKIRHLTRYRYENFVRDSANRIMLFPIKDAFQEVVQQEIFISGEPQLDYYRDSYNNEIGIFTNTTVHGELSIDSHLVVITRKRNMPMDQSGENEWVLMKDLQHQLEFIDFLKQDYFTSLPEIKSLVSELRSPEASPLETIKAFNSYVNKNFTYKKGITRVETTISEVWALKAGVCQDFAGLLLVMVRLCDIPARYVSGYICPDSQEMRGEGATHAWVEVYLPSYGWLGVDPTNNCFADDMHVRLAVGRNFSDCSPVKGTYKGTSDHTLEVTVSVSYEDGRTVQDSSEIPMPEPPLSHIKNSFRRHMEMQQQQ